MPQYSDQKSFAKNIKFWFASIDIL